MDRARVHVTAAHILRQPLLSKRRERERREIGTLNLNWEPRGGQHGMNVQGSVREGEGPKNESVCLSYGSSHCFTHCFTPLKSTFSCMKQGGSRWIPKETWVEELNSH